MTGHCKDCVYWKNPLIDPEFFNDHEFSDDDPDLYVVDDETHGICARTLWDTSSGSLWIKSNNKMVVHAQPSEDVRTDWDMWLETTADFGCVQFEALAATD